MLKTYFLNKSISIIQDKYNYSEEKIEIIKYGLEGLYLTITKAIVIFLLAFKLDLFTEVILFLFFYNIIRMFSFGLHAKSSIVCLLSSTVIFIGIPYLCKDLFINNNLKLILFIFTTILIFIFSPADTKKRPIISKSRRLFYKIVSTFICICYCVVALTIKNNYISNLLLFSLITQLFMVNPLSYKLFGVSYNNYKKYNRKEDSKC